MVLRSSTLAVCLLWLCAVVCRAQPPALVVTSLKTSRPNALGRFATVSATLKNVSGHSLTLRAADVTARDGDGNEQQSGVGPLTPALPQTLPPGGALALRRFIRVPRVGTYSCSLRADDGTGRLVSVPDAAGHSPSAALEVIPAAVMPRADFDVADPHPSHVYRPGETITVHVTPVVSSGSDLSPAVSAVTVAPGAHPWAIGDAVQATALLHPPATFDADFYGVDAAHKYLDLGVNFKTPCRVAVVRLSGDNPNGQFGLGDCAVQAEQPDGSAVTLSTVFQSEGSAWTLFAGLPQGVTTIGLRLRLHTHYKLELTGLALLGTPDAASSHPHPAALSCVWRDAFGHALTRPRPLMSFQPAGVVSPPHLAPGYYGLDITTAFPDADSSRREYGFVVLPAPSASAAPDDRLGVVHMNLSDQNLGAGWTKTLSTPFYDEQKESLDTAAWGSALAERTAAGVNELPLVAGSDWDSDGASRVSAEQLRRLQTKMRQYFQTHPTALFWELGLEENLGYRSHRGTWPYYWANLEAKARAVRAAAAGNPQIRLIFQVAEIDPRSAEDFLKSAAARQFDILSLHPYAWPDFPAPEKWMPDYLAQVRAMMTRYHAVKPIWFTEIGAPMDGNPGGFFGYPSNAVFDRGLGRDEYMAYLVKCHVAAFRLGIGKVFWYTYQDGGANPEYAEDHFGMIDVRGFPQPGYAAYCTMSRLLRGKTFTSYGVRTSDVQVYRFQGNHQDCLVVWSYPAAARRVSLSSLGLKPSQILAVTDVTGKPLSPQNNTVPISAYPVYLTVSRLR